MRPERSRFLILAPFLVLLTVATCRHVQRSDDLLAAVRTGSAEEPGTFPTTWISGKNCETEPKFQVHRYSDGLFIIRQSKCEIYEAPFMYLIFGDDRALLMDTGSNPRSPVAEVVDETIASWCAENGRDSIPLVVAHTHSHGDHVQGDAQFDGRAGVAQLVGTSQDEVEEFWQFEDFPNDVPTIDLGGRVIDVLGTPGHQPQSVTLYDRKTRVLMTGDIVYPGHLFVFSAADWPIFVASLERMTKWAAEHPVEWVLGCHIEFSDEAFQSYEYGKVYHPNEHPLQFEPTVLKKILDASLAMKGDPVSQVFDEFVLHMVYKDGIRWNP